MTDQKPKNLHRAEQLLWIWTAWFSLFGIYQTWTGLPQLEQQLNEQLQGLVSISPENLLRYAIGGYAGIAVLSGWFVYKLGKGKQWARSSFLWSAIIQAGTTALPPIHEFKDYLGDIPDLGLQISACILLYTPQTNAWFAEKNPPGTIKTP